MKKLILMSLVFLALLSTKVLAVTVPQWSDNASSIPSTFNLNTKSEFNISWATTEAGSLVYIELNDTGTPYNCSATNTYGGDIWNCTKVLGANSGNAQYWKSYANNSIDWNTSDTWVFTIGGNDSFTYTWVLSSPITYGTASDFQMSETVTGDGGCTYTLYRNGTTLGTGSSVTDTTTLGAGIWNYTYARDSCTNYTTNSVEKILTIDRATPLIPLTLDSSSATPQTRTYPNNTHFLITEVNTGADDCQYVMRQNGTSQLSHDYSKQLGAGGYNITGGIEVDCANYTTNSTTIMLVVDKGTPDVKVYIDNVRANKTSTYPVTVTLKGNSTTTTTPPTFSLYVFNTTLSSPEFDASNTSQKDRKSVV